MVVQTRCSTLAGKKKLAMDGPSSNLDPEALVLAVLMKQTSSAKKELGQKDVTPGFVKALARSVQEILWEHLYYFGFIVWLCRLVEPWELFYETLQELNIEEIVVALPEAKELTEIVEKTRERFSENSDASKCYERYAKRWEAYLDKNVYHKRSLIASFIGIASAHVRSVCKVHEQIGNVEQSLSIARCAEALLPMRCNARVKVDLLIVLKEVALHENVEVKTLEEKYTDLRVDPVVYLERNLHAAGDKWVTKESLINLFQTPVLQKFLLSLFDDSFNFKCPIEQIAGVNERNEPTTLYRLAPVLKKLPAELISRFNCPLHAANVLEQKRPRSFKYEVLCMFLDGENNDLVHEERVIDLIKVYSNGCDREKCKKYAEEALQALKDKKIISQIEKFPRYDKVWHLNRKVKSGKSSALATVEAQECVMRLLKGSRRSLMTGKEIMQRAVVLYLMSRRCQSSKKAKGNGKKGGLRKLRKELDNVDKSSLAASFFPDTKECSETPRKIMHAAQALYAKGFLDCVRQEGSAPNVFSDSVSDFEKTHWFFADKLEGGSLPTKPCNASINYIPMIQEDIRLCNNSAMHINSVKLLFCLCSLCRKDKMIHGKQLTDIAKELKIKKIKAALEDLVSVRGKELLHVRKNCYYVFQAEELYQRIRNMI